MRKRKLIDFVSAQALVFLWGVGGGEAEPEKVGKLLNYQYLLDDG